MSEDTEFDPAAYDDAQAFVTEYGLDLVDLLEPGPGERILDLGCGTGHLTAEIAEAVGPEGFVVGIDASPAMVERARNAHPELDVRLADATEFVPGEPVDAVYSNATLHWIDDQDAALARVAEGLRPGGRFVAEMGGPGNVAEILDGAAAVADREGVEVAVPWHFPTLGDYASRLERHGFRIALARTFDRPTALEGESGLRDWLDQFGDALLAAFPDREAAAHGIETELRGDCFDADEGAWTVTYHRLQFRAVLSE